MPVYNVDILTPAYASVEHFPVSADDLEYKEDFLSYEKNSIKKPGTSAAAVGDYIQIMDMMGDDDMVYSGIITAVDVDGDITKISYVEWQQLLDIDLMCDTTQQDTRTIEGFLAYLIDAQYISNTDATQNITGLSIKIESADSTNKLSWDLKTDTTTGNYITTQKMNLYDDIALQAFTSYGIRTLFRMYPAQKKLVCTIGKCQASAITIEADLENCVIDSCYTRKSSKNTNKILVYNSKDLTQYQIYYRLEDDTVTTNSTAAGRITPISTDIETVTYDSTKQTTTTFEALALAEATGVFSKIKYSNLIELEYEKTDAQVKPMELEIGQKVTVIHGNIAYSTYLTGREIKKTVKLIFGNIRLELTKQLMGRA